MKPILLSILTFVVLFALCGSNKITPNRGSDLCNFDIQHRTESGMTYLLFYHYEDKGLGSNARTCIAVSSHNLTLEKAQLDYFAKESTLLDKVISGQAKQTELLTKINYSAWKISNQIDSSNKYLSK